MFPDDETVLIPLSIGTAHDLPHIERLRLAAACIDHLRRRLRNFPQLCDIPEQQTAIVTNGF
jgi:hypothetical protein